MLIWTHSHLLLDGWSLPTVFRALDEAYATRTSRVVAQTPKANPASSFARYVRWHLRQDSALAVSHWTGLLSSFSTPSSLAFAFPESSTDRHTERSTFGRSLSMQLAALARDSGVTMGCLVQTVWADVVRLVSLSRDVVFGSTVSGRTSSTLDQAEAIVGVLIKTIPLRVVFAEDGTVDLRTAAKELQDQLLLSQRFDHLSLSDIQTCSSVPHGESLFDSIVVFENYPTGSSKNKPALDIQRIVASETTNFGVTLTAFLQDDCLSTVVDSRMGLPVASLGEVFQETCVRLTSGDAPVLEAPLPVTTFEGITPEAISAAVRSGPDAVAVTFGNEHLSFSSLHDRAMSVAAVLHHSGVHPGNTVAVQLERSVDLVVALTAPCLAGAPFVYIDGSLPRERADFMVSDSGASAVVDAAWMSSVLPSLRCNAPLPVISELGAYAVYTSGSTGRPKGVLVQHSALANRLHWAKSAFGACATDRYLQSTNLSFDVAIWEFFEPLFYGSCICLAPIGAERDAARLGAHMLDSCPTASHFAPSALSALLGSGFDAVLRKAATLRMVMVGELLPVPLVAKVHAEAPQVVLFNDYGPAETAIEVTSFACSQGYTRPLIGRAITNVDLVLLWPGSFDAIVPRGLCGELAIGGVQVSHGYIGRLAQTASTFVPALRGDGSRMYLTGDICRQYPDGNFEFVCRIDSQIKFRGVRIELGEIDHAICEHPEVVSAASLILDDALVAVVATENVDTDAVRSHLRAKLPPSHIPTRIVVVESLPLNRSGKLDVGTVRQWLASSLQDTDSSSLTPAEATVADIVCRVLGIDTIDAHTSIFDVGGHSLTLMRLVSALQRAYPSSPFSIEAAFANPTVSGLAAIACEDGTIEYGTWPTDMQQSIWSAAALHTDPSAYHISFLVRQPAGASFDVDRLQSAFDAVWAAHEPLRLAFAFDGAELDAFLVTNGPSIRSVAVTDADAFTQSFVSEPFAIAEGPLVRACVVNGDVLVVVVHHLVFDGLSVGPFVKNLAAEYNGEHAIRAAAYVHPPSADRKGTLVRFWRDYLRNIPALAFPSDNPRPSTSKRPAGSVSFTLPASLLQLARAAGTTVHTAILAALQITLSRWTSQRDFAIGMPFSSRPSIDSIGLFLNVVAVRACWSKTVDSLLRNLHEAVSLAFSHGDLPFHTVAREAVPERGHDGLFQVMLDTEYPEAEDDSAWSVFPTSAAIPVKYDLYFRSSVVGESIACRLEYDADMFPHDAMVLLCESLGAYATSMAHDGTQNVDNVSLGESPLTRGAAFSGIAAEFEHVPTFAGSDAVLVVDNDAQYSRGTFARDVDRICAQLEAFGIPSLSTVAVSLERSYALVCVLHALALARCTYVPIDPNTPIDRRSFITKDADADFLIDNTFFSTPLPSPNTARHSPSLVPMYILYTSGSTGRPKGVLVDRRGVENRIAWMDDALGLSTTDVVAEKTTFAFDVSVWELFLPVWHDRRMLVVDSHTVADVDALASTLARGNATVVHFVPSVLNIVFPALAANVSLCHLVCSGEALPSALASRTCATLPWTKVWNLYGPTEASIDVSFAVVVPDRAVTIGGPVWNTTLLVLDATMQAVPMGAIGELFVSGIQVARGYHKRAGLTADSFVPDVCSSGSRMYATGDLVRWRANGELDYLGRADQQVKIHGHRIELGEIEAVLNQHASVASAAVDVRNDQLVGFVVAANQPFDSAQVLDHVGSQLPAYMVPARLHTVSEIALTASGKTDRRWLSTLTLGEATASTPPSGALSEREGIIAAAWKETLHIDEIGPHANFFELGGDSIGAMQLA